MMGAAVALCCASCSTSPASAAHPHSVYGISDKTPCRVGGVAVVVRRLFCFSAQCLPIVGLQLLLVHINILIVIVCLRVLMTVNGNPIARVSCSAID